MPIYTKRVVVPITPKCIMKGVSVQDSLPFKVVALDMDGTLLNSQHQVSVRSRRVLSQLLAMGVHVIFATGRPFTDVHRIKQRLNIFARDRAIATPGVQVTSPNASSTSDRFPSPVQSPTAANVVVPRCFAIASNGACVYDELNKRVYERFIDPRYAEALYKMYPDDADVNVNVFRSVDAADRAKEGYVNYSDQDDDMATEEWISRYPSDLEAALYAESKFVFRVMPNVEKNMPTDHVNTIFFLCYNKEKARAVEAEVVARVQEVKNQFAIEDGLRVAPSAEYCLDCIPTSVSKASALGYVVGTLSLAMSDVIAFGDGMNDVEMLSTVGKGCIMQNGQQRLKDRLPQLEVVGHHDDDGVARKLMEVFGLDDVKEDDDVEVEFYCATP